MGASGGSFSVRTTGEDFSINRRAEKKQTASVGNRALVSRYFVRVDVLESSAFQMFRHSQITDLSNLIIGTQDGIPDKLLSH